MQGEGGTIGRFGTRFGLELRMEPYISVVIQSTSSPHGKAWLVLELPSPHDRFTHLQRCHGTMNPNIKLILNGLVEAIQQHGAQAGQALRWPGVAVRSEALVNINR